MPGPRSWDRRGVKSGVEAEDISSSVTIERLLDFERELSFLRCRLWLGAVFHTAGMH